MFGFVVAAGVSRQCAVRKMRPCVYPTNVIFNNETTIAAKRSYYENLDKMSVLAFFENERRQIRKVVDYASQNVYQLDDILDMMNEQMDVPGTKPEHLVLVSTGRWICYFLVDHPNKGRCHYFQIKPDVFGQLPDKPELNYMIKEFGIENRLLDEHVTVDEINEVTKINLPV